MGFVSCDVEAEKVMIMDNDDLKDCYNFSSSSELSSVASMDSSDDDDDGHDNSSSEVHSSLSSSPNSPFSYSDKSLPSGDHRTPAAGDSLNDMSSLLQQLPIKRGLSKHYEGKSQSYTCLSNVSCLEDLAKPENPYNKKLKSCKSYVGLSSNNTNSISSRQISKKTSRASCSSFISNNNNTAARRNLSRPPTHKSLNSSTNICNQPQAQAQTQTQTPFFV